MHDVETCEIYFDMFFWKKKKKIKIRDSVYCDHIFHHGHKVGGMHDVQDWSVIWRMPFCIKTALVGFWNGWLYCTSGQRDKGHKDPKKVVGCMWRTKFKIVTCTLIQPKSGFVEPCSVCEGHQIISLVFMGLSSLVLYRPAKQEYNISQQSTFFSIVTTRTYVYISYLLIPFQH